MRKWIATFLLMVVYGLNAPVFAESLIEVYCQSIEADPTFKAEYADLLTTRQNVPINRGPLLPRVDVTAIVERQLVKAKGLVPITPVNGIFVPAAEEPFYNTSNDYIIRATQPLFNYAAWARLRTAKAEAKQAEAKFCAAAQDLIVRVATAYFDVMKASSDLYYTNEQLKAVEATLKENQARFKAGVISITGVYEAQANRDIVTTRKQKAEYVLVTKLEDLKKISGCIYCSLYGIGYLPLIKPDPKCITTWVELTEHQNFRLKADEFAALAARENIKIEFGGHLPVLNTYGEFHYSFDTNPDGTGQSLLYETTSLGLELKGTVFQGGEVDARTIQAHYKYQKAIQQACFTHQEVIADARKAYHGILLGIKQIRSGKTAVASSQESLKATIVSYRIGTRTVIDVLNVQNQLFETYKTFVRDQYDYLLNMLLLKRAAGTLCVVDLQYISCWLNKNIIFPAIEEECCGG